MKHWNIGNTTVRNPDRIKEALRILKSFEGQIWNEDQHISYLEKLVRAELVENTKKEVQNKGISGRKWAAVLNQLGFAIAWAKVGPVVITPAGNALLEEKSLEEEVFLRQLLKYQLPSPLEHGKDYFGFEINPFRATLAILWELKKRGLEGITKEEISLFLITTINQDKIKETIEEIVRYREERKKLKGKVVKKKFYAGKNQRLIQELYKTELAVKHAGLKMIYDEYQKDANFLATANGRELLNDVVAGGKGSKTKKAQETLNTLVKGLSARADLENLTTVLDQSFINTKGHTLQDYADTAVRYFSKSGLLSISGEKLIIKDTEEALVKSIVEESANLYSDSEYTKALYDPAVPALPIDNDDFLKQNLLSLYEKRNRLAVELFDKKEGTPDVSAKSLPELRKDEQLVKKELIGLREIDFYRRQAQEIDDILDYFDQIEDKTLLGGNAYLPAYLEWTMWRVFLAINTIKSKISETRNFEIDEELNPIHHAKGGVADMIFEYDDFVIVGEATLSTRANQWSAEGEPVPRHVASVVDQYPSKPVYGLFLAPSIDPNTAQQFFSSTYWSKKEEKFIPLQIVPLTINELVSLMKEFQEKQFTVGSLKLLLDRLLKLREGVGDGVAWRGALARNLSIVESPTV